MYQLKYHPKTKKELQNLHPTDQKRIFSKLEELARNPHNRNLDLRKLAHTKNSYRIRVGNIRAIFEIVKENKVIYIWEIGYRGSIY